MATVSAKLGHVCKLNLNSGFPHKPCGRSVRPTWPNSGHHSVEPIGVHSRWFLSSGYYAFHLIILVNTNLCQLKNSTKTQVEREAFSPLTASGWQFIGVDRCAKAPAVPGSWQIKLIYELRRPTNNVASLGQRRRTRRATDRTTAVAFWDSFFASSNFRHLYVYSNLMLGSSLTGNRREIERNEGMRSPHGDHSGWRLPTQLSCTGRSGSCHRSRNVSCPCVKSTTPATFVSISGLGSTIMAWLWTNQPR